MFHRHATVQVLEPDVTGQEVPRDVRVESISRGDRIVCSGERAGSGGTRYARVECVVRMLLLHHAAVVQVRNGPIVTWGTPIRVNGIWSMTGSLYPVRERIPSDGLVYNFVLDPRASFPVVDGIDCVSIGHGVPGHAVAHPFYGTHRSVDALKALPGWRRGLCTITLAVDQSGHTRGYREVEIPPGYEPQPRAPAPAVPVPAASVPVPPPPSETVGDGSELCAICMDAPADTVVLPCGHRCGCDDCLRAIQASSGDCPICRGKIAGILKAIPSGVEI